MCLSTFLRRAQPLAAFFLFARVRILPEGFYHTGNEVSRMIKKHCLLYSDNAVLSLFTLWIYISGFFRLLIDFAEGLNCYLLHHLRLHRLVSPACRSLSNLIYHIHSLGNLSKCSIGAVQMR